MAQVFSCEFCKIFQNTFFAEHLRTTVEAHACKCFLKYSFYIHIPQYVTYKHKTFFSCFEVCYLSSMATITNYFMYYFNSITVKILFLQKYFFQFL